VARGIDVEALEHVVNFDVPNQPEDYIHRVGRTARAEATGEAYTLVSPEEEKDFRDIERAVGKQIQRRTLAGFDYNGRAAERFEVPIGERIKEIRARKAADRERSRQKAEARAQRETEEAARRDAKLQRDSQRRPNRDGERPAHPHGPRREPALAGAGAGPGGGNGRRRRRRGGRGGGAPRQG
jgi:ATP-dependent RNA helicase RhlE